MSENNNEEDTAEWRKKQFEERLKVNRILAEKERLEIIKAKDELWAPFKKQMKKFHELNIAWKSDLEIFNWDRLLEHPDLLAIRITGHDLDHIPYSIPAAVTGLQALSFISAKLTSLPENVSKEFEKTSETMLDWNSWTLDRVNSYEKRLKDVTRITTRYCITSFTRLIQQ